MGDGVTVWREINLNLLPHILESLNLINNFKISTSVRGVTVVSKFAIIYPAPTSAVAIMVCKSIRLTIESVSVSEKYFIHKLNMKCEGALAHLHNC